MGPVSVTSRGCYYKKKMCLVQQADGADGLVDDIHCFDIMRST